MRRLLIFILFVSVMLSLPSLAKQCTKGFRVAKLQLDFPFHPEWEVAFDPSIIPLLEQPYHFIGKGAQSYVFASQDEKYVIKLFRYDRPTSPEKIVHLFNACKIAYDYLREETGVLYVHLNVTPKNLPLLRCKDAVGRNYQFDLNQIRFAVQKRAQDFRQTLQEARPDAVRMRKRIDEFLSLLQLRSQKGILNTDPTLSRNFGFLESQAVEIDFGNYRYCPGHDQSQEVARYVKRLRYWLEKNAPEWVFYLDEKMGKRQ